MPSLAATYTSPTSKAQTFSSELPAITSTASTADRVAYLAGLQTSLKTLQGDLNAFLTQRMVDDKAADDATAEETYGEEVVDQD
ncbi:Nn.00g091740.m01.CDS01 [Neocucurbitaria sp. VM-36]